jgi:hypothetical protein
MMSSRVKSNAIFIISVLLVPLHHYYYSTTSLHNVRFGLVGPLFSVKDIRSGYAERTFVKINSGSISPSVVMASV